MSGVTVPLWTLYSLVVAMRNMTGCHHPLISICRQILGRHACKASTAAPGSAQVCHGRQTALDGAYTAAGSLRRRRPHRDWRRRLASPASALPRNPARRLLHSEHQSPNMLTNATDSSSDATNYRHGTGGCFPTCIALILRVVHPPQPLEIDQTLQGVQTSWDYSLCAVIATRHGRC